MLNVAPKRDLKISIRAKFIVCKFMQTKLGRKDTLNTF